MTKILIVDDDINILQLVNVHLSDAGYEVFQAQDGIQALSIL
ncbi:MAG: DNA-binding response regulator, partial [Neobacillus sp.]|nr:DNA-binding response regulator [Neobacillus sp.]